MFNNTCVNVINFICIDTLSIVDYSFSQGYQGMYVVTQNMFFYLNWDVVCVRDKKIGSVSNFYYKFFLSRGLHTQFPQFKKRKIDIYPLVFLIITLYT